MPHPPSPELRQQLEALGLVFQGEPATAEELAGGVSSDILKITASDGRMFVIKRALAKLKVAADWRAPVERNAYEVAWLEAAGAIVPEAVPKVLAHDPAAGLFAMAWLDPVDHPVWKAELRAGRADPAFAAEVGRRLARIHSATAGSAAIAARFATDRIFHPIRLEPYLEATAARHPEVGERLMGLSRATLATKRALVHGDVSPKNILCGPAGPVFLDAECAWYGDPAFDAAFCLNHLLLKCLWNRMAVPGFLAAFDALCGAYLGLADWEDQTGLAARIGALLPALFLARVDGKSPVEYLTAEADKALVRQVAVPLIADPPASPRDVRAAWADALGAAA